MNNPNIVLMVQCLQIDPKRDVNMHVKGISLDYFKEKMKVVNTKKKQDEKVITNVKELLQDLIDLTILEYEEDQKSKHNPESTQTETESNINEHLFEQ